MIDIGLAQPYSDPDRVLMFGASHGGCITTRAVQRGAPVHAAVDIFGPSDWAAEYQFWMDEIAAGSPFASVYEQLVDIMDLAVGGPPDQFPDEYAARSPASFAADLTAAPLPFMIVQGVVDPLVPPSQSCVLAELAGGFEAWHLDGDQLEVETAPAGCEASALTWLPGPRPTGTWPGDRYLIVYDELAHDFAGDAGAAMVADALGFLAAKLPPP
jgi:hypothetical protein